MPAPAGAYEAGKQAEQGRRRVGRRLGRDGLGQPFRETEAVGQGFDDIRVDANGDTWIVEYKGGTATLSDGQMGSAWVKGNITRLLEIPLDSPWYEWGQHGEICSKTPWTLATYGASLTPHRLRRLEERDQRPSSTPGAIHHDATVHTAGGLSPPGRMAGQHRKLPRHDRGKTKQDLGTLQSAQSFVASGYQAVGLFTYATGYPIEEVRDMFARAAQAYLKVFESAAPNRRSPSPSSRSTPARNRANRGSRSRDGRCTLPVPWTIP